MAEVKHVYLRSCHDSFWELRETDEVEAPSLDTVLAEAPSHSATGLPLAGVVGPEGATACPPPADGIREVRFLGERTGAADGQGELVDEVVWAVNIGMAFDLVTFIAGPFVEFRALTVGDVRLTNDKTPAGFWGRPDLPERWLPEG